MELESEKSAINLTTRENVISQKFQAKELFWTLLYKTCSQTLDILHKLVLQNVPPLESLANLFLPQRHELVKRVDVARRPDLEDFVQGSQVVHCPNRVGSNVLFLVENCYPRRQQTKHIQTCDLTYCNKLVLHKFLPSSKLSIYQIHWMKPIQISIQLMNKDFTLRYLTLGFPSPKMTTLSLGGATGPSCAKLARKMPSKKLEHTYLNGIPSASIARRISALFVNIVSQAQPRAREPSHSQTPTERTTYQPNQQMHIL